METVTAFAAVGTLLFVLSAVVTVVLMVAGSLVSLAGAAGKLLPHLPRLVGHRARFRVRFVPT